MRLICGSYMSVVLGQFVHNTNDNMRADICWTSGPVVWRRGKLVVRCLSCLRGRGCSSIISIACVFDQSQEGMLVKMLMIILQRVSLKSFHQFH